MRFFGHRHQRTDLLGLGIRGKGEGSVMAKIRVVVRIGARVAVRGK